MKKTIKIKLGKRSRTIEGVKDANKVPKNAIIFGMYDNFVVYCLNRFFYFVSNESIPVTKIERTIKTERKIGGLHNEKMCIQRSNNTIKRAARINRLANMANINK